MAVNTTACAPASTGPLPKRNAIASAAACVALASPCASRASISERKGEPWQKPIAGPSCEGARVRADNGSAETVVNPACFNSFLIASTSL